MNDMQGLFEQFGVSLLCGKANIVPDGSGVVWGVLFELSEEEFQRLAHFEGGYSRKTIEVACVEPVARLRAETFVARPS